MTGDRAEFKELELVMEPGGLHEVLSSWLAEQSQWWWSQKKGWLSGFATKAFTFTQSNIELIIFNMLVFRDEKKQQGSSGELRSSPQR